MSGPGATWKNGQGPPHRGSGADRTYERRRALWRWDALVSPHPLPLSSFAGEGRPEPCAGAFQCGTSHVGSDVLSALKRIGGRVEAGFTPHPSLTGGFEAFRPPASNCSKADRTIVQCGNKPWPSGSPSPRGQHSVCIVSLCGAAAYESAEIAGCALKRGAICYTQCNADSMVPARRRLPTVEDSRPPRARQPGQPSHHRSGQEAREQRSPERPGAMPRRWPACTWWVSLDSRRIGVPPCGPLLVCKRNGERATQCCRKGVPSHRSAAQAR